MNTSSTGRNLVHRANGIAVPPRSIIGYGKRGPIYVVAGGAPDDDTGDSGGDDGGDEQDDDTGSSDDDKDTSGSKDTGTKPPKDDDVGGDDDKSKAASQEAERELRKTRAALKKANAEAQADRRKLAELQKQLETADEKALREAREQGAAEIEVKLKKAVIRTSATSALIAAGFVPDPDRPGRTATLLARIDQTKVEVSDDGEVSGLEDQIVDLKADCPEFFEPKKSKTPGGKADAGGKKPADTKPKSSAEKIAASLVGN